MAIRITKRTEARRIAKLAPVMLLAAVSQGIVADEGFNPVSPDFEKEIKQQGAVAMQEMTLELKQDMNWKKRGVEELETTLKPQLNTDCQIANNIDPSEHKDCDNRI